MTTVTEPTCFQCTNPMADGGVSIALVTPGRRRAQRRTFHKLCLVAFLFPKGRRTPVRVIGR